MTRKWKLDQSYTPWEWMLGIRHVRAERYLSFSLHIGPWRVRLYRYVAAVLCVDSSPCRLGWDGPWGKRE